MRSSRLIFATILVVIFSTTYVLVKESSHGARFRIKNNSMDNANVTAIWLERRKDLGSIKAGATRPITVRGEAAMVFAVRFPDGREIESKPVYFTSGTTINVKISEGSVDVSYNY